MLLLRPWKLFLFLNSILTRFISISIFALYLCEQFHALSFLPLKERSRFFFVLVLLLSLLLFFDFERSPRRACRSLIHKYGHSLFWRMPDVFLTSLHSLFRPNASRRLASDVFITQVLFLAIYTLINEFFLFFSFSSPALAYLLTAVSTSRLLRPSCLLPTKSPPSYPCSFSHGNHEQSRQSTLLDANALQLLAFWHPFSLVSSFRSSGCLFRPRAQTSSPSLRFPTIPSPRRYSRTRALHHEHSVLAHVCVNKIPDKPPNLFAGNCPQILAGK